MIIIIIRRIKTTINQAIYNRKEIEKENTKEMK